MMGVARRCESPPFLAQTRCHLAQAWVLIFFGLVFLVSETVIVTILYPTGLTDFVRLQSAGFSAADYLEQFHHWQAAGVLPFYRAHLVVDRWHWIWYSILLGAGLARTMNAAGISDRYNGMLLLPAGAGLADWLENQFQHIFLSDAEFSTVVDPLPLVSTLASHLKWLLIGASLAIIVALVVRGGRRQWL